MARESLNVDVLIVGGGPAGLAAAIRLKQVNPALEVMLIDKGAEIGAHIVSGAVFDPRALEELLPDWQALDAPLNTPVQTERFAFLSAHGSWQVPHALLPHCLRQTGCYLISLGELCQWLATQAETLGVAILPGFAATELLLTENGSVGGVITGDFGVNSDGQPSQNYQAGMELHASYTLFAEGCRGHLGQQLEQLFSLRKAAPTQSYALGIKELWQVPSEQHQPGLAIHTAGWPLDTQTYGGGFCYHLEGKNEECLVAIGLVVGLDYRNPWLSPFAEFQRYKTHRAIAPMLRNGKRLGYGARSLVCGGLQALPQLTFPGGALIGDDAGLLVAARQKGAHTAMKSGMLAAETIAAALTSGRSHDELSDYKIALKGSWVYQELKQTRNFKPLMQRGLIAGSIAFALDQYLLRGNAPWTLALANEPQLLPAAACAKIDYPKPDGVLSFDLPSSLFLSATRHTANQPCHLQLADEQLPLTYNLALHALPEARYCPAGVYELVTNAAGKEQLQINAQNCLHCKACEIKDPRHNIRWLPPQGGDGPLYRSM